jgi:hypothetical protein
MSVVRMPTARTATLRMIDGDAAQSSFDAFWSVYPRRVAKKAARLAWAKLTPALQAEAMDALPKHVRQWKVRDTPMDKIPHPATWLNGERWEDEVLETTPRGPAWWETASGIEGKGKELGIQAKPGEPWPEFKARIMRAAGK